MIMYKSIKKTLKGIYLEEEGSMSNDTLGPATDCSFHNVLAGQLILNWNSPFGYIQVNVLILYNSESTTCHFEATLLLWMPLLSKHSYYVTDTYL